MLDVMTRNSIAPILSPERIRVGLEHSDKARVFALAGQIFAGQAGLDAQSVTESLAARENLGSTAVGQGVALPHARIKGLREPLAGYLRLHDPIDFDAPDSNPVDELFVLLVPERATEAHLKLLAEVAQMFGDLYFHDHLRRQKNAVDVYQAFADWTAVKG
jgi:PTS system nitrogen regulatory IIA component